jgi:hypothetical protein
MRQAALLLFCATVVFWYVEPTSRTFAQQKAPVATPAPAPLQKASPKVPAGKGQEGPISQIINEINRLLGSAPAAQEVEDARVREFKQHYGSRFRQLYKTELHFVRMVCEPTKQQFEKIAADGEPALQTTIRRIAATWRRPVANDQSDLRTLILEALAKSARSILSPAQSTRYQKEVDNRWAARKQMMVLNLVSDLDSILLLSADQRVRLGEILQNNWDDSWNKDRWLNRGSRFFPPMPDEKILPLLTETQKQVWRSLSKGNFRVGFNPGLLPGFELEEEVWNDKPVQKKPGRAEGRDLSKSVEKK